MKRPQHCTNQLPGGRTTGEKKDGSDERIGWSSGSSGVAWAAGGGTEKKKRNEEENRGSPRGWSNPADQWAAALMYV